jgi:hypothetical protein
MGYCETDMDYAIQVTYHSYVHCWLSDETNGHGLAIATSEDPEGLWGYAAQVVETSAVDGVEYSIRSTNKAYVEYYDYDYDEWGNPTDPFYYDDFYLSWYQGQGYWDYSSLIYNGRYPSTTISYQWITLGYVMTYASFAAPGAMNQLWNCNRRGDATPHFSVCSYVCYLDNPEVLGVWDPDFPMYRIVQACGFRTTCPVFLQARTGATPNVFYFPPYSIVPNSCLNTAQ